MLHTLGTVKFYMRSYIITSLKSYRNWMLFYKDHFFPFILEPMNELFASHLPKSCTFLGLNFFFFPIFSYFAVNLTVGKPPKLFDFDFDTGSDLTWVQCDAPCTGCTKVTFSHYRTKYFLSFNEQMAAC